MLIESAVFSLGDVPVSRKCYTIMVKALLHAAWDCVSAGCRSDSSAHLNLLYSDAVPVLYVPVLQCTEGPFVMLLYYCV